MTRVVLALIAIAPLLAPSSAFAANMCAVRPLLPLPVYPCVRLVPQCVCDANGNCHWVYFCEMS